MTIESLSKLYFFRSRTRKSSENPGRPKCCHFGYRVLQCALRKNGPTYCLAFVIALFGFLETANSQQTLEEKALQSERVLYQSAIAVAEKALRLNEVNDAIRWLEQAPEKHRGWEWDLLKAKCDESTASTSLDDRKITSSDISSDGKLLVLADADGKVTLHHLPSFDLVRSIGDHQQTVYSVAFSPDGSQIVTVSRDVTSRVWDTSNGKEISRIELENPGVAATAFSPDGKTVATCSWIMITDDGKRQVKGTVWVWDTRSGEVQYKKHVGVKPLDSLVWTKDGSKIIVGSWDGLVHVLDNKATELRKLKMPDEGVYNAVISVDVDQLGRRIAAGSKDRTARIWDVESGKLVGTLRGHDGFVNDVKFLPGGEKLATASVDGTIRIWNVDGDQGANMATRRVTGFCMNQHKSFEAGRLRDSQEFRLNCCQFSYLRRSMQNPSERGTDADPVRSTGFSRNSHVPPEGGTTNSRLADASGYDFAPQILRGHTDSVTSIAISKDGRQLVSSSRDNTLRLWDLKATYDGRLKCDAETDGTYTTTFSPDGKWLYVACFDGTVRVIDTRTGKLADQWKAHDASCNTLALSSDGSKLVTCSWDKTAKLWNLRDKSLSKTFAAGKGVYDCAISPDGKRVALCVGNLIQLWNTESGEKEGDLVGHKSNVQQVTFSPDGKRLATADGAGPVRLWDVSTSKRVGELGKDKPYAATVVFSPDGKTMVTGGQGFVQVWNAANLQLLHQSDFGSRVVNAISFLPDSSRFAAAADAVYLFDPDTGDKLLRFQPLDDDVYFLSLSPDGKRLASCTTSGTIMISETKPLRKRQRLLSSDASWSIENARFLFTAKRNKAGNIFFHDRKSKTTVHLTNSVTEKWGANNGRISPDGKSLIFQRTMPNNHDLHIQPVADEDATRDAKDGTPTRTIRSHLRKTRPTKFHLSGRRTANKSHSCQLADSNLVETMDHSPVIFTLPTSLG